MLTGEIVRKGMPFAVFNLMTSHQSQSMVWPYEKFKSEIQTKLEKEIHDPSKIATPPGYTYRSKNGGRFHDCVSAMDKEVGFILEQLKKDGLTENTIVSSSPIMDQVCLGTSELLLDSVCMSPIVRFRKKQGHSTRKYSKNIVAWLPLLILLPQYSVLPVSQSPSMEKLPIKQKRNGISSLDIRIRWTSSRFCPITRDQRYLYIRNYMPIWVQPANRQPGYQ